jgi:hypothetical protein
MIKQQFNICTLNKGASLALSYAFFSTEKASVVHEL